MSALPGYGQMMNWGGGFGGAQPPQQPMDPDSVKRLLGQMPAHVPADDGNGGRPGAAPAQRPLPPAPGQGANTGPQILDGRGMMAMPGMPPPSGPVPSSLLTAPGFDYRGQQLPSRQQIEANIVPFMMQLPNPMENPQAYMMGMQILTSARQHAADLYGQMVGGQNDYTRGLLSEGRQASQGQQQIDIQRQTGLVNGVPTALAVSQHGAMADRVKSIQNSYFATLPRDAQGNIIAKPEDIDAANLLAQAEIRRQGLDGGVGGLPSGPPPAQLTGAGQPPAPKPAAAVPPPQDPEAAARSQLNKTNLAVGEGPLRAVNSEAVNKILAELKTTPGLQADPVAMLARLRQILPGDQYTANGPQILSFLRSQGFTDDALANAPRSEGRGSDYLWDVLGGLGRSVPMLRGGDVGQQGLTEIMQRHLGMNPAYWQSAADLRQLTPR